VQVDLHKGLDEGWSSVFPVVVPLTFRSDVLTLAHNLMAFGCYKNVPSGSTAFLLAGFEERCGRALPNMPYLPSNRKTHTHTHTHTHTYTSVHARTHTVSCNTCHRFICKAHSSACTRLRDDIKPLNARENSYISQWTRAFTRVM